MPDPGDSISAEELLRIRLWQQDLIDSLGRDLIHVVTRYHQAGGNGQTILRVVFGLDGSTVHQMGIRLLWERLDAMARRAQEHQDPEKEQGVVG